MVEFKIFCPWCSCKHPVELYTRDVMAISVKEKAHIPYRTEQYFCPFSHRFFQTIEQIEEEYLIAKKVKLGNMETINDEL